MMERYVRAVDYATFEEWSEATQRYQATLLRYHIETMRRLKYRPNGGFCLFMLNDSSPMISWSILDHTRAPKLAFQVVVDACRPVIIVADRLPATVAPGDAIALDVHVVNDLRQPLVDAVLHAHLQWANGEHKWTFVGTSEADDCTRIATLQFVVPDAAGQLVLDLTLDAGSVAAATNRDETLIA
jgi:beta-mannosidase